MTTTPKLEDAFRQQVTPARLTAWQDVKLRWALGAGLLLAKWVMRYGG